MDVGENSEGGAIGGEESKDYDDEVSSEMAFLGGVYLLNDKGREREKG